MSNKNLHNTKTPGFKTPDNYFDTIEDRVFDKLNTKSLLNDIKTTGFNTPKGYFNTIEDNVLSKITEEKTKVISIFSRKHLIYISGIAAALVLMLTLFINKDDTLDIDSEMVELYLEEQNLNSYELATLLNETEFLDEDFNIIEEHINESDLESYLLENITIEDIIEQ